MDWVVHYFDRKLNRETVSREHSSKQGALRNACDLMRRHADTYCSSGCRGFMRRVLASPEGRALYRRRQVTIEPVFGQIKFNRAIKRFQRRGRAACRSEWRLIAATHNLLKLHSHQLAAISP